MLAVRDIDVFYGRVQALRSVTLEIGPGEMVALFGANGAGKTTTLRAITGMLPLTTGEVVFDGTKLNAMSPEAINALGIAHIPEGRGIFPHMTVWQNLKMGGYAKRLKAGPLAEQVDRVVGLFPRLKERLGQQAGTMSGGEQQMLAIGRALVGSPRLLLLDEPSHGLAPKIVQEVFALLANLRTEGMGLLVVEQYAAVALSVAERGYVLDRGAVAFAGDAESIASDPNALVGAYLGA
ncbi:MAG TPA: ABC transporter ATP-binding protein [Actinomycetota bacterium]|nr:ABC transporter ATP-binding protein [Actinomycetota bacterium]